MGKKNIAVVDDDDGARFIMEKYLESEERYDVKFFASGEEFMKYLTLKTPDLVLLDISMPGMDGIEVFECMKENKAWNEIPVIFLTGMEDQTTVLKCIGKGADAYLVKPVLRKRLVTKIEEIFDKYKEYKSDKTILMIDDDVEFLKIAKIKLSKYYRILTVNSAKTAFDYLTNHTVDLVISDYFMPLYDGKSVLNILKKREGTKNIPIIIVSALPKDEVTMACAKLLPDGILSKPVVIDDILAMINSLIGKKISEEV